MYPTREIQNARLDFMFRWNKVSKRDPVARYISDMHRQAPPTIRTKNCVEYPFAEDDKTFQMPRPTTTSETSPPCKKRRVNFDRSYLVKQCASLTEAVLFDGVDNVPDTPQEEQSDQFQCDHCSFQTAIRLDALNHLKKEQHTSCSRYTYIPPDDDVDSFEEKRLLLSEPRVLYNAVPDLAWLADKLAIVCPICFLVFPDKLLCAYHCQTDHPNLRADYAFGTVLTVRHLTLTSDLRCPQCKRAFATRSDYVKHWSPPTNCQSIFAPIPTDPGQPPSTLVVQAYCHWCRCRVERASAQSFETNAARGGSKRQYPFSKDSSRDNWIYGLGNFFLNHVCLHFPPSYMQRLQVPISVRFIRVPRGIRSISLPPYQVKSDRDLLLLCIHEQKRLLSHLGPLKGSKKLDFKKAKERLKGLLAQAAKYNSNSYVRR